MLEASNPLHPQRGGRRIVIPPLPTITCGLFFLLLLLVYLFFFSQGLPNSLDMASASANTSGHLSEDDMLLVVPLSPQASERVGLVMLIVGTALVAILF